MYRDLDISTTTYIVGAVIKGQRVVDSFIAKSSKQARYFLGKKYGFAMRDFTVYGKEATQCI